MDNDQLLKAISDMMDQKFKSELQPIHNDIQSLKDDIKKIDNRLEKVESQVSSLRSGQIEMRKEIKEVTIRVSDTYDLALESWGQGAENRKWLEKI